MIQGTLCSTFVKGDNGEVYGLGLFELLPSNVMAVEAWTAPVEREGRRTKSTQREGEDAKANG